MEEGGCYRGKGVRRGDEWRRAGMPEEGSEMERLFSLIFIYSECVDRAHTPCFVFTFAPVHTWDPPGFLLFGHRAARESNWGLSALHGGTLTTVIKAASRLLFASPCPDFPVMFMSHSGLLEVCSGATSGAALRSRQSAVRAIYLTSAV